MKKKTRRSFLILINHAVTDKSKAQMKKEPEKAKEEPSSMFQRQRVDMLLGELMRKFPLPMMVNPNAAPVAAQPEQPTANHPQRPDLKETNSNNTTTNVANTNGNNQNGDFKPPEKRAK